MVCTVELTSLPADPARMTRIGLTPDELLVATWSGGRPRGYAARMAGLNVLEGETIALVGSGVGDLLVAAADAIVSPSTTLSPAMRAA